MSILLLVASMFGATEAVHIDAIANASILGEFTLKYLIDKDNKVKDIGKQNAMLSIRQDGISAGAYFKVVITEIQQAKVDGKPIEDYLCFIKDSDEVYSLSPGSPPKTDVFVVVTDGEGNTLRSYAGLRKKTAK